LSFFYFGFIVYKVFVSFRKPYKLNVVWFGMAESNMAPGFGGLMRYNEEYNSRLKFGPGSVIAMIIIVIAFVVGLKVVL
jgi:preprotein translocase subunit Sec61beta